LKKQTIHDFGDCYQKLGQLKIAVLYYRLRL